MFESNLVSVSNLAFSSDSQSADSLSVHLAVFLIFTVLYTLFCTLCTIMFNKYNTIYTFN